MKTAIRKGLVLVALMLVATVSYGNEISSNVNIGKSVRTNVTFKDVKKGTVLSIKDMNGLVLYKEVIKFDGNYSKGFDLTSLPDGHYYFELNKDVQITIVPFKVTASVVTFDKTAEKKISKPVVYLKDNKILYVSKLSFDTNDVLEIEIVSAGNDKVISEKITRKNGVLGKMYDFSTSRKGTYTIITKVDGRRFVDYIRI